MYKKILTVLLICLSSSVFTYASDWVPEEDGFDWLRLNSGEWLKGDLIAMYDDRLEFESDELDTLHLDWEDVAYVRTSKIQSLRLNSGEVVEGHIEITAEQIKLRGSERTIQRGELLSIASGGDNELGYWDGKIAFGFDKRSGNTDQEDRALTIDAARRTSVTRFKLHYVSTKSEVNGEDTTDSKLLNTTLDWFFSRRIYFRPVSLEYFSDPFQNIDSRITYSTQLGYFIIDNSRTTWDVYAGPGYQETRFDNVQPGEEEKETTDVIEFGTSFDIELTKDIDFDLRYDAKLVSKEAGKKSERLEAGFEVEIIGSLDFMVRYIWNRIDQPIPDEQGIFPEKDDEQLLLGLSYEF